MQPDTLVHSELGRVSSFVGVLTDTPTHKPAHVPSVFDAIRSNKKIQQDTETYRSIIDVEDAEVFAQRSFPYITWCGIHSPVRKAGNLQQPSGLFPVHLQGLSTERLDRLWQEFQADEYVGGIFVDRFGTGLLVLFRVEYKDQDDHQAFAHQLTDYCRDNYGVTTKSTVMEEGVDVELDPASLAVDWLCPITHNATAYGYIVGSVMPLLADYKSTRKEEPTDTNPASFQETPNSLVDDLRQERQRAQQAATETPSDESQEETQNNHSSDWRTVNEPQNIGLLTIRTANGWIEEAKSKPIPKMLCDELWLEGEICMLFAEANQGKTILAVQIADSISRGEPMKGIRMEAKGQAVLYFDFELSSKQFEARYSLNFQHHYRWHDNFRRIEINPDADVPPGATFEDCLNESMEEAIRQTNAKVLIIDNITYLRSDTESAKDAGPLMKYLKALKQKYNLSLLILAHCPKRDASRPITRNDLQGSSRLNQFADSMIAIGASAKDSQLKYLKQVKVRSTAYKYDADNVIVCQIHQPGSFVMLEFLRYSTEQEHLKLPTEKDISNLPEQIQTLRDQGKTQIQIALALGISQPKVSRILAKLVTNK